MPHRLSQPPEIYPISNIRIPEVHEYTSTHDIPVYQIRHTSSDLVLIDMVFSAGRPYESQQLVSAACAGLMRQGAGKYTSYELSEEIDYLGASLSIKSTMDYISIRSVCMRKNLPHMIDLVGIVLSEPSYDQRELDLYRSQNISRLKMQLSKPDIKSYRAITEAIYGPSHPYGYNSSEELYNNLTTDLLKQHHHKHIHSSNCKVFIAGRLEEDQLPLVHRLCSYVRADTTDLLAPDMSNYPETSPAHLRLDGGTHQASIRIGRKAVTRLDEDFYGLNYLVNILGGYQGSRLVSSLRERKGLTYSIYSMLDILAYDADMIISTEVALDKVEESLDTIYEEMQVLTEELVPEEEIKMVDNYLLGNYLNLFDGPFNSIRAIKSLVLAGFPLNKLESLIGSSVAFDAHSIRQMARKYFKRNDFWEVIVGTAV